VCVGKAIDNVSKAFWWKLHDIPKLMYQDDAKECSKVNSLKGLGNMSVKAIEWKERTYIVRRVITIRNVSNTRTLPK
jgi:hypothetical protein